MSVGIALTIAGSDPSGGAGIQADLKTFHQFGVYGEAVITLITVQDTTRVHRFVPLDPALVVDQVSAAIADIEPAAAKLGALGSAEIAAALAREAAVWNFPLVIDPIVKSKSGGKFLDDNALQVMRRLLIPRAHLLMPNLDEAEALTGMRVTSLGEMETAASTLREMGAANVLIKGGHLEGDAVDILLTADGEFERYSAERIDTRSTHGTGCTYSAAVTAELARGTTLIAAVASAKRFVTEAIRTAPGLGKGHGPLNHWADNE